MFILYSNADGHNPPIEYLPAGAITPKIGLALTQSSGLLAVATGTTKPTYICLQDEGAAVTSGTVIAVQRIHGGDIYETTNSANLSAAIGTRVTLSSDGTQVTNTTSSGVAELIEYDAAAASATGKRVLVRF